MTYEEPGETPATKRAVAEIGLPELTGMQTQIAEAEEIRARLLVEADDVLGLLRSDQIMTESQKDTDVVSPRQVTKEQVHSAEVALNRIRNETDANWWLAHRDVSAGTLIADLMIEAVDHSTPG